MKKTIRIINCVAALLLLCSGCNKNFDPKIYGVLSDQNFPVSENDYKSLMMSCYIPFTNTWTYSLYASSGNQHPWYIPAGGVLKQFDTPSDVEAPWVDGVWDINYRQWSEADFSLCRYYSRGALSDTQPNHRTRFPLPARADLRKARPTTYPHSV